MLSLISCLKQTFSSSVEICINKTIWTKYLWFHANTFPIWNSTNHIWICRNKCSTWGKTGALAAYKDYYSITKPKYVIFPQEIAHAMITLNQHFIIKNIWYNCSLPLGQKQLRLRFKIKFITCPDFFSITIKLRHFHILCTHCWFSLPATHQGLKCWIPFLETTT